jgi:hypothetical protein
MLKLITPAAALVPLLLVGACENIPYYDESLNWFSWSKYDPEVDAIEEEIPPPGELQAPDATMGDQTAFVRDGRGGYVLADPPEGAVVTLGSKQLVNAGSTGAVNVADSAGNPPSSPGAPPSSAASNAGQPLVGIRSGIDASVSWRSLRGAAH